jgi:hypothetical protein
VSVEFIGPFSALRIKVEEGSIKARWSKLREEKVTREGKMR